MASSRNVFGLLIVLVLICAAWSARADGQVNAGSTSSVQGAHASTASTGSKIGFLAGAAAEFGGGRVATVAFTDGSEQSIHAGQGLSAFAGGYIQPYAMSPWSLRATAGYKFVTTKASNASIYLQRVPIELIGSYRFDNGTRLGAGLVYHTAIKLDGDGFFENVHFHDSTGYKLEAGWKCLLLSYTGLHYHASSVSGSANASSFGFTFLWEF